MGLLYFLADTFVNTFGITKPSDKGRRQAAFFILALLILAVSGAVVAFLALHSLMK
jgi:hypothetical protein